MQEKFRPNIKFFDEVVANSSRVLKAASVMEIPVMATEQYPKGLGPTVPELGLDEAKIKAYPKTCFSMVLPELMAELKSNKLFIYLYIMLITNKMFVDLRILPRPSKFSFMYFTGMRPDVESVIICGIETHACIHHTTLELIERGMQYLTLHY